MCFQVEPMSVQPSWRHPGVRMVSFTGGSATGRAVARVAAERLVPAALEFGGKSPHIVFADADLDRAVSAVTGGIFEGSGQSCVAGSRLFVERTVYSDVLDAVVARARSIRVDLPDASGAEMGPLASFPTGTGSKLRSARRQPKAAPSSPAEHVR